VADSSTEFKVGDVVMLKSGGPKMVVIALAEEAGRCDCVWFDQDADGYHRRRDEAFPMHVLMGAPLARTD